MGISELLFRPEAAAIAAAAGAALVVGKSLIRLQNASNELGKSLRKLDLRITKLQEGLPEKRKRIHDLQSLVGPLKEKLRRINTYLDKLTEISHAAERKEVREQQKDEKEHKSRGSVVAPEQGRRPEGPANEL